MGKHMCVILFSYFNYLWILVACTKFHFICILGVYLICVCPLPTGSLAVAKATTTVNQQLLSHALNTIYMCLRTHTSYMYIKISTNSNIYIYMYVCICVWVLYRWICMHFITAVSLVTFLILLYAALIKFRNFHIYILLRCNAVCSLYVRYMYVWMYTYICLYICWLFK